MATQARWPYRLQTSSLRWLAHLCAASFLFLMGTSLALSVERDVAKGVNAYEIDKGILIRGLIIALLDFTTS